MATSQRYISKELTHFVRKGITEKKQYSGLVKILNSGWLTHPPHKPNISGNLTVDFKARISGNKMYCPQVVCFCDIPVEDLNIHTKKYGRFGLSFIKSFLIQKGTNPVFYIAKNSNANLVSNLKKNGSEDLKEAIKQLKAVHKNSTFDEISRAKYFDDAIKNYEYFKKFLYSPLILEKRKFCRMPVDFNRLHNLLKFLDFYIFSFLKFFDDAKSDRDPKNFYMEREWRMLGNLHFNLRDVYRVILPRAYAKCLRKDVPQYIGQVTFM